MTQNMNLSAEEVALIEQKRAQEKSNYDTYRERIKQQHIERVERRLTNEEDRKKVYETMFNSLVAVSKDFRLDCEKSDTVSEINLYELDENGNEIRYVNGEYVEAKEVDKLDTYHYQLKIVYTGNVPPNHQYYIVPVEQYHKWSGRVKGYKMQLQGTGISTWDKRGQMTNPNTVVKKITEFVENKFNQIKYQEEQNKSNRRIADRFKIEFSKYAKNVTSTNQNYFNIELENGIEIQIYGYENGLGNISFSKGKVVLPYSLDVKDVLENLDNIKSGK